MPKKSRGNKRKGNGSKRRGLSIEGNHFLKCAFAPVDFNNEVPKPIPDGSGARVTVKRHKFVGTYDSDGSTDAYFMFVPVPGVAYYAIPVATGVSPVASTLNAALYPDTNTLFPTGVGGQIDSARNFSQFRYVSNYVEFVPTINATSWSGSITVWKSRVALSESRAITTGDLFFSTNGTEAIVPNGQQMYVAGNNTGAYTVATQVGPWLYTNIVDAAESGIGPSSPDTGVSLGSRVCGIGNLETIFVKITGKCSYTLKVGCCVEYVVSTGSVLYDYSLYNYMTDASALMAYRTVANGLPVAVSYLDNPDFWDRVLKILQGTASALSYVPGGVGLIAQGVSMLL